MDKIDLRYVNVIQIIDETGRVFCDTKINKITTELKGNRILILNISHVPEVKNTYAKNKIKNYKPVDTKNEIKIYKKWKRNKT